MADKGIELPRLSGKEMEGVARALVSGHLEALLANRETIGRLQTEELQRLVDFGAATRANCGGFGCG